MVLQMGFHVLLRHGDIGAVELKDAAVAQVYQGLLINHVQGVALLGEPLGDLLLRGCVALVLYPLLEALPETFVNIAGIGAEQGLLRVREGVFAPFDELVFDEGQIHQVIDGLLTQLLLFFRGGGIVLVGHEVQIGLIGIAGQGQGVFHLPDAHDHRVIDGLGDGSEDQEETEKENQQTDMFLHCFQSFLSMK